MAITSRQNQRGPRAGSCSCRSPSTMSLVRIPERAQRSHSSNFTAATPGRARGASGRGAKPSARGRRRACGEIAPCASAARAADRRRGTAGALRLEALEGGIERPARHFPSCLLLDLFENRHRIGVVPQPEDRQETIARVLPGRSQSYDALQALYAGRAAGFEVRGSGIGLRDRDGRHDPPLQVSGTSEV